MGLDIYLFKRKKAKNTKEKILNKLEGEKDKEVAYWRKEWDIVEAFGEALAVEIENLKEYEVDYEQLEEVYEITKSPEIKEVLCKTDWENEIIIFYNWW